MRDLRQGRGNGTFYETMKIARGLPDRLFSPIREKEAYN
jgi:hypothetical protein